jgi:hypothetical protein
MQRDAEAHAEEDKKAKEAIEIKNNADTLAYQSEKQLKDLGDKVPEDKRKQVEDAIKAVRDAIERNDTDAMKSTYEDLQNKFQEISADLYKQASAQAGGPMPGAEAADVHRSRSRKQSQTHAVHGIRTATWSTQSSRSSTKTRSKTQFNNNNLLALPGSPGGAALTKRQEGVTKTHGN